MNNLLHQTNNLVLYKSKMKSVQNADEFRVDKNIFKLQKNSIDKQVKRFGKIHGIDDKQQVINSMQVDLVGRIDQMIGKLSGK